MEPVYYTINTINGDYAYMTSDSGVENLQDDLRPLRGRLQLLSII